MFDNENNVALLHASKKDYHKLPGGGVEDGEDVETALRREIMEEIGCAIGEIQELGIIEEFRNKVPEHQLSHCYIARVAGEKGAPSFEEDEIADGFTPRWLPLETAIETLEREHDVSGYLGKFIRARDLAFLREAQAQLR